MFVRGKCACTKTAGSRWLPGLKILRRYQPAWLKDDLVAGIVLATMLVPVGIAYAEASGVPGIYGLYATIIPLIIYAAVRPEPYPRARSGFFIGGDHPGHRAATCRAAIRRARWRWPAPWRSSPASSAFSRVSRGSAS